MQYQLQALVTLGICHEEGIALESVAVYTRPKAWAPNRARKPKEAMDLVTFSFLLL